MDINAYTGTSGYVAYANQTHLFVSKALTSSSDGATEIDISVTPTGSNTGTVTSELNTLAAPRTSICTFTKRKQRDQNPYSGYVANAVERSRDLYNHDR